MMLRAARFAFALLTMLALAPAAALADAPKVVVTIKPVHSLVTQIMRGVAMPTLLIEGAASPHTFTLKPSTARAINEAGVFIRISDALEPFTRKISQSLPASVSVLTLAGAPGIALLDRRRGGTFEHHTHDAPLVADARSGIAEADDHDDDVEGKKDGHIWLDPDNAKAIVAVVTKVLSTRYPGDASTFAANAAVLDTRLDALNRELATTLESARNKPFILFHDSTQYLEHRYGLSAAGSITVSPDVPPSAKRLTEVRRKISSLGAVCVFAEPDFQPNLVAAVTEGTQARTGTLDAEGQLLSPGPDLYFDLMRGVARNLAGCLSMRS